MGAVAFSPDCIFEMVHGQKATGQKATKLVFSAEFFIQINVTQVAR